MYQCYRKIKGRERYRTATVRSCEKSEARGVGRRKRLPTLTHKDLRLSGAGTFACEPIFSTASEGAGALAGNSVSG